MHDEFQHGYDWEDLFDKDPGYDILPDDDLFGDSLKNPDDQQDPELFEE